MAGTSRVTSSIAAPHQTWNLLYEVPSRRLLKRETYYKIKGLQEYDLFILEFNNKRHVMLKRSCKEKLLALCL